MCLDLEYWNLDDDDEDYANSLPVDTSEDLKEHTERKKAKGGHSPTQVEIGVLVKVSIEGAGTEAFNNSYWIPADKIEEFKKELINSLSAAVRKMYL